MRIGVSCFHKLALHASRLGTVPRKMSHELLHFHVQLTLLQYVTRDCSISVYCMCGLGISSCPLHYVNNIDFHQHCHLVFMMSCFLPFK